MAKLECVETSHLDCPGHVDRALSKPLQHRNSDLIVAGEHRVGPATPYAMCVKAELGIGKARGLAIHAGETRADPSFSHDRVDSLFAALKSWPGMRLLEVDKLSRTALQKAPREHRAAAAIVLADGNSVRQEIRD